MDTKAEFEKWWQEESGQADICAGSNIGSTIKMIAFDAWRGSRAAIEIDLPELQVIPEEESDIPDFSDWPMGFNEGVKASIEAITSHGIRIKGKTE